MEDLSDLIRKYTEQYKRKCKCVEDNCLCETGATIKAHIRTVLPEEFQRITIDDFTGFRVAKDGKTKEQLLPSDVVVRSRKQIIDYCWQGVEEGEDYDPPKWVKMSVLDRRRADAASLIIYGTKWVTDKSDPRGKPFQKPFGRTMVAAIVMREIIMLRWLPGHLADSYEWVSFGTLVDRLMAQAKGTEEYNKQIDSYLAADWLVIDEITAMDRGTDLQRNYRANVLDHLLGERREANRPNILVFQDNISKMDDIRSEFGNEMYGIVNSRKTHQVALIG